MLFYSYLRRQIQKNITKTSVDKYIVFSSRSSLVSGLTFKSFFKVYLFILAVLGLHCCTWVFSSCGRRGLLLSSGVWASLVAEHGL